MAQSAPAPVLMLLLLSIIVTAANKKPALFRWPSVSDLSDLSDPAVGRMLCVGESTRLWEHIAGSDSSPLPCYFKISDIKFILTVLFFILTVQR